MLCRVAAAPVAVAREVLKSHACACAGFAPQAALWAGLGQLSHTINERERRNAVLSVHNAELRAAAAGGDELHLLQVLHALLPPTPLKSTPHIIPQLRLKHMRDIDASSRARVSQASTSACLKSSVCPNAAYAMRRDAWLVARRNAAAVVLQAAARVVHAHACVIRGRAAALVQGAWRQHCAMTRALAAGGKVARDAAVRIQSAWRGHWLRVKKVCARRRVVWYGADVCICVLQDQALLRARVAWADDDLDDDLEDIMASLKVAPLLPPPTFLFSSPLPPRSLPSPPQAPDSLFAQPQFMSQMQRAYGSAVTAPALATLPPLFAASASLPPLPRPSAAVTFPSAALLPAYSAPTAAAAAFASHDSLHPLQSPPRHPAMPSRPPPPALVERNHNAPSSAPSGGGGGESDLGSAWGITDPRTLAALKKREAKFKGKDAARRQKEVSACCGGGCGGFDLKHHLLIPLPVCCRRWLPPTAGWSSSERKWQEARL